MHGHNSGRNRVEKNKFHCKTVGFNYSRRVSGIENQDLDHPLVDPILAQLQVYQLCLQNIIDRGLTQL